jgi:hypothetical protein
MKIDKIDGLEADKTELIKIELLNETDNSVSKYFWHFLIFKDEWIEENIKLLMYFLEIDNLMMVQELADKIKYIP